MLASGVIIPTVFGFVISLLITPEVRFSERLALAYALGFGFLTLAMFSLNVVGIKFSLVNTTALISGITILSLVYLKRKGRLCLSFFSAKAPFQKFKQELVSLSLFEKAIVGLLVFFISCNIAIALYWPVYWPDALTTYDFRAKLLAETKSIADAASLSIAFSGIVFEYPPMTSLVHAWLYLWGWVNPKVFYPLLLISLAIVFYWSLRDWSPRYHCFLFTLLLVTTGYIYTHAACAYTNFPFAFYFGGGTMYFYRWMLTRKRGFLILAGTLLGLGSWVRGESELFFLGYLAILIFFSIRHRRFLAPLLFALPYFLIEPLWSVYRVHFLDFPSVNAIPGLSGLLALSREFLNFARWRQVAGFVWENVVVYFRLLFFLLVLTTVLYAGEVRKHCFLLLIVIFDIILFIIGSFVYSLLFPGKWEYVGGSSRRLFVMCLPIIWYFIASITTRHGFSKTQKVAGS